MPAISAGKVLVTGANGFIAGWIVKYLLERGFSVRGTVRSLDKADSLRSVLAINADRLEFVKVEDITAVRTTTPLIFHGLTAPHSQGHSMTP